MGFIKIKESNELVSVDNKAKSIECRCDALGLCCTYSKDTNRFSGKGANKFGASIKDSLSYLKHAEYGGIENVYIENFPVILDSTNFSIPKDERLYKALVKLSKDKGVTINIYEKVVNAEVLLCTYNQDMHRLSDFMQSVRSLK